MKRRLAAGLAAAMLCAAGPHACAEPEQVLTIDDAHLQRREGSGAKAAMYKLVAGTSLVVDASNYQFKLPPQLAGKPINSLQLVLARDQMFSAAWTPSTRRLLLSDRSLSPNAGSKPFAGLQPGQQGALAIGHLDKGQFSVAWVGMFTVQ